MTKSEIVKKIAEEQGIKVIDIPMNKEEMNIHGEVSAKVMSELSGVIIPYVGMGATMGVGSDCYPYTIVEVSPNGKRIKVQQDNHKNAEGYDYYSNQVYTYTSDPTAPVLEFSLRKDGKWRQKGDKYTRLSIGHRRYYQDPSF